MLSFNLFGVQIKWTYGTFSLFSMTFASPLSGKSLNSCDIIINYREQQLKFIKQDLSGSSGYNKVQVIRMDDLIYCSKCEAIPYDVLMMNCHHNLCIKCAVQRMQAQHNTKSVAGRVFLQCEKCKSKTNLDDESVRELQKAQKTKGYIQKIYLDKEGQKRIQTPINTGRSKNISKKEEPESGKNQIKAQHPSRQNASQKNPTNQLLKQKKEQKETIVPPEKPEKDLNASKVEQNHSKVIPSEINYGECEVHKEEPVMYYCFNCKIHCFCAECILVGKHNKHDVKVIKKAFITVQKEFQQAIARTKKFLDELMESNKIAANNINASKNKADGVKKTIEKAFDEVRATIRQKQLQFMKMVDKKFMDVMETNNGVIKKTIELKLREQQDLLGKLQTCLKKGEKNCLNFYADQWQKITHSLKNQELKLPTTESSFNQVLTDYISQIKKEIMKVEMKKL